MKTDTLQSQIEAVEAKGGHVQLLAALGNPSEWVYSGECVDAGGSDAKCACGHPIRFCFLIDHPTKGRTQVGSTCINHIASITPELGATLIAARDELEAQLKKAKADAKRAAADAENVKLWDEYCAKRNQIVTWHEDRRSHGLRSPHEVWRFVEYSKWNRRTQPKYVRASDLRRWITDAIKVVKGVKFYE